MLSLNFIFSDEAEPPASKAKRRKVSGGAASTLMELQDKRFEAESHRNELQNEIEKKKLEARQSEWKEAVGLRQQEIDIFDKEVELKYKEMEYNKTYMEKELDLRREIRLMELQHEAAIAQLKLESEERMRRYEIKCKYNIEEEEQK